MLLGASGARPKLWQLAIGFWQLATPDLGVGILDLGLNGVRLTADGREANSPFDPFDSAQGRQAPFDFAHSGLGSS
jgi:hypothetical protein